MFFEILFISGVTCLILAYIIEKTSSCCEANAAGIKCVCKENSY